MHEHEVTVQAGEATLAGTVCFPEKAGSAGDAGKFPAVLMVHGSGPLDRNENSKGQQLNVFNTIAHALAERGIASFRYDKRGCGSSTGDYMTAGHADLIEDAARCLDALAESEFVSDKDLYILGHSEGCIIAPQLAQRRPLVSGLILLCPFIEKIESVLLRQAEQLDMEINALPGASGFFHRILFALSGRPSHTQQRLIRKIRNTDVPVVRVGLSRHPAKWMREMLELDMESIFTATRAPMLLIAGEKDLQCNPQDMVRIANVAPGQSELLLVPNMTHLLRKDDNPPSLLGSARLTGLPVEQVVLKATTDWIHARSSAGG